MSSTTTTGSSSCLRGGRPGAGAGSSLDDGLAQGRTAAGADSEGEGAQPGEGARGGPLGSAADGSQEADEGASAESQGSGGDSGTRARDGGKGAAESSASGPSLAYESESEAAEAEEAAREREAEAEAAQRSAASRELAEEVIPHLEGLIDGFSAKYQNFLSAQPTEEASAAMQEQIQVLAGTLESLIEQNEDAASQVALLGLRERLAELEGGRASPSAQELLAGQQAAEEEIPNPLLDDLADQVLLDQAEALGLGLGLAPAPGAPPAPAAGEEVECPICFDDVAREDVYMLTCCHRYCRSCLQQYFHTRIENGLVLSIPCPHPNCGDPCAETDVQAIVSPDEFARFRQFHYLASVRSEPTCRWCPQADCSTAVFGDPNDAAFPCLTCAKCDTKFCYDCNQVWHEGVSCKKNMKKLRKEGNVSRRDEQWKKKHKTRKCAQCRVDIFKDKGCNHMICTSCGYQFCWICMKPFTPDHYIFGDCAGLQFSRFPKATRRLKKCGSCMSTACLCLLIACCLCFVVLPIGLLVGIFIVLPILIIAAPICLCVLLVRRFRRYQRDSARRRRDRRAAAAADDEALSAAAAMEELEVAA
mmetsp:Transcript_10369/g.42163  ORF Transcript_10369/g.42163 Transcript_10369/m.42163 type:complete len:590 (-) Transcript_10369:44-1813(-)